MLRAKRHQPQQPHRALNAKSGVGGARWPQRRGRPACWCATTWAIRLTEWVEKRNLIKIAELIYNTPPARTVASISPCLKSPLCRRPLPRLPRPQSFPVALSWPLSTRANIGPTMEIQSSSVGVYVRTTLPH